MILDRIKRLFSGLRQKLNALGKRDDLPWRQFKLVVTNPPRARDKHYTRFNKKTRVVDFFSEESRYRKKRSR